MTTRDRIIEGADKLYRKFGIKSITMDDVARDLGMSKKTLYQHFRNKSDLVQEVTQKIITVHEKVSAQIHAEASDPVHELLLVRNWISKTFKDITPKMIYEVQKYYPKAWQLFSAFKTGCMMSMIRETLEKGITMGLFRSDMDVELIAILRMRVVEMVMNPDLFPESQFDHRKVQIEFLNHFMHGIVTSKGKAMIDKYLINPENTTKLQ